MLREPSAIRLFLICYLGGFGCGRGSVGVGVGVVGMWVSVSVWVSGMWVWGHCLPQSGTHTPTESHIHAQSYSPTPNRTHPPTPHNHIQILPGSLEVTLVVMTRLSLNRMQSNHYLSLPPRFFFENYWRIHMHIQKPVYYCR